MSNPLFAPRPKRVLQYPDGSWVGGTFTKGKGYGSTRIPCLCLTLSDDAADRLKACYPDAVETVILA